MTQFTDAPTVPFAGSRPERRTITLGRAADNDVVIDHGSVSGHHARLVVSAEGIEVEDAGSTNGTFVGAARRRVTGRVAVPLGESVTLGLLSLPVADILRRAGVADAPTRALAPPTTLMPSGPVPAKLPGQPAAQQPAAQQPEAQQSAQQTLPDTAVANVQLGERPIVVGRAPDSDLLLDDPLVSWHHARVSVEGGRTYVEDLGSTNGTWAEGEKIRGRREVPAGCRLRFATSTVQLGTVGTAGFAAVSPGARSIHLSAYGVAVHKSDGGAIFEAVDLEVQPGELVGVMGPSGAGKTTLIEALNGYLRPARGEVRFNGFDLYRSYELFRLGIGYVPQDDILHSDLTVRQALRYSARLRLPEDTRDSEIEQRIDRVLTQLGIADTADRIIGSPSQKKKVLSGGQRKRVNVAMELMTDPRILFLDEPTSGLSSEDALSVMTLLGQLAKQGCTILLSIHQPNLEVFRLMTHLVILGKDRDRPARLAYFGPAYPDSIRFFQPELPPEQVVENPAPTPSPDLVLSGLPKRTADEWLGRFQQSPYGDELRRRRGANSEHDELGSQIQASPLAQTWVLVKRNARLKLQDRINTSVLLAQAPIIGLLVVLVFGPMVADPMDEDFLAAARATATTLFLVAVATLWFGCSNAAREIVAEQAVYHRERMVNLRIGSYLAAKLVVLGGLALVQCVLLLAVVHLGAGLRADWPAMLALLWLTALFGTLLGLIISALSPTSEVAISLVPLALLPMVILGGIMHPVHDMKPLSAGMANSMASRWAFEGLLMQESDVRPTWLPPRIPNFANLTPGRAKDDDGGDDDEPGSPYDSERAIDTAEPFFPEDERSPTGRPWVVLGGMSSVLLAATVVLLRRRDVH